VAIVASRTAVPTTALSWPLARREHAALTVIGFASLLAVWWVVAALELVPSRFLPRPDEVVVMAATLSRDPFAGHTLLQHLASSLGRFAWGFGLAAIVGIPLGLATAWWRTLDDLVAPVFGALRFVAPLAWVPFAALWFGTGIGGPVLVIFTGAFPPCVINAHRGAALVDVRLIEASRTLGAGSVRVLAEVLVPGALPSIVAGLRISAGLAWQSLVGAELIVAGSGIGYLLVQGQSNLEPRIVMAGMLAIGVVGLAIDVALRWTERAVRRRWEG